MVLTLYCFPQTLHSIKYITILELQFKFFLFDKLGLNICFWKYFYFSCYCINDKVNSHLITLCYLYFEYYFIIINIIIIFHHYFIWGYCYQYCYYYITIVIIINIIIIINMTVVIIAILIIIIISIIIIVIIIIIIDQVCCEARFRVQLIFILFERHLLPPTYHIWFDRWALLGKNVFFICIFFISCFLWATPATTSLVLAHWLLYWVASFK